MHLYTLVTLFFQSHQIFFHHHTCIQWLHSFSLCNAFVYTCHTFFSESSDFFHRHTCIQWLHSFSLCNALYTLVTLFWCFIRKYLSHIFSYDSSSQSVVTLVYSGYIVFPCVMHLYTLVTLFFRVVRFFSIVTLVYSGYIVFPYVMHCIHLSRFFGASSENICPIYSIMTARLSLLSHCIQWLHSFSLCNTFVYTCHTFFQSHQIFFHRHTCIQWLHSFSLYNAFVYTCHTFFSESSENICPKKRSIFPSSHLYTVVT